jgi:hypothetical protein
MAHDVTAKALFDHFVGERENLRRNLDPECLRRLEIDDQLKLSWLQNRKIGWFFTFENAANIDAGLAVRVRKAGVVADEAAGRYPFSRITHRGKGSALPPDWRFVLAWRSWTGRL